MQVIQAGVTPNKTSSGRLIVSQEIDLKEIMYDYEEKTGKYNGSNHWDNNKRPEDYNAVQDHFKTCHWIDALKGEAYQTFKIPKKDVAWMHKAYRSIYTLVDWRTGKFPNSKADDLNDILDGCQYSEINKKLNQYFLRTDYASFKRTRWRENRQYSKDMRYVYESLVMSDPAHSPLGYEVLDESHECDDIKLYLIPWQDIDTDREFRVFIHQNEVTAISQQNCYEVNDTLCLLNSEERSKKIRKWCDLIEEDFHEKIKPKLTGIDSCVLDIAIIDQEKEEVPYPIELNPFGKEYTSGSALFNWVAHKQILCGGDLKKLFFRYVTAAKK